MSARSGPRAAGTDGSDFRHRERVAHHYNVSPFFKKRLKFVYWCHIIVWTLFLLKFIPSMFQKVGIELELWNKSRLPVPDTWEFVWLLGSLTPTIFGYWSLAHNRFNLLRLGLCGTLLLGAAPIVLGVCQLAMPLYEFYNTKVSRFHVLGVPLIVVWYAFFCACIQIHGFTLYFGIRLLRAWHFGPGSHRKNN